MTNVDQVRSDKQDISEVLIRYATGVDRRDWDLFRSCFMSDVDAEYEGIETWSDVEAITAFMVAVHADMGHTMHQLSNIAIDVTGDAATARTYVDAVLMTSDGAGGLNTQGVYDDELVRTIDGWRIARRRFTMVHASALGG
jgi:3-phenylpropionate/cinnamic acid dioxygenase small subunit